jgi:DnaJ like chaperone protein
MTAISIHLTHWTGKALGAAAALIFAPAAPATLLWWLLAGLALGHLLDVTGRRLGAPAGRAARRGDEPAMLAPAPARFIFAALGRIGAASGRLGPEHLRIAERLMARLAFTPDRRREALIWFYAGQDEAFPFDTVAAASRADFAVHKVLRDLTVDSLCRMCAVADSADATAELLSLGERVGIPREALALRAVAAAALMPERSARQKACDTLGVQTDDREDVIRLAYRRQVARWHPDRLPAGASADERAAADQRMWQLREALETLLATP